MAFEAGCDGGLLTKMSKYYVAETVGLVSRCILEMTSIIRLTQTSSQLRIISESDLH